MDDLPAVQRDNVISLVDECHRTQKGDGKESFAITMRAKLPNAFRFGFTGTPIDRTMTNTHRDFGPVDDLGIQERYLSYYGIRRAIRDGATLPVHYIRDKVPFQVAEQAINVGFEQMCDEAELDDQEARDFVQRKRAQWKEIATHPDRIEIVLNRMLDHFLEHPDPNGFKAQLVAVDRKACALYKEALDQKLIARNLPTDWSEVIISDAQNSEPDIARFEYPKSKQDDLVEYFKLTPEEHDRWNRERFGNDRSLWRPPLKVLIVCDRLLTGFDAPVEQVMYLDKPLRDHSLLQAIARTNRPLPAMKKRTGLVVDYFGVFDNLQKALNFDESDREESLIDWEALRRAVPTELARCLESFEGIAIEDTRSCLLAALRRLRDPDAAKVFEHNFSSLERLWEAVAPDPLLYDHRREYRWLCGIYVAHRRRQRGGTVTYGELAAKTRDLIRENTTFLDIAQELPAFVIDADYVARLDQLPTPADKAAALEAALTAELSEDDPSFIYLMLGERLRRIKERKDSSDEDTAKRLRELEEIAAEAAKAKADPDRLNLTRPGEHELFTVLRAHAKTDDENFIADSARRMVAYLAESQVLTPGWSSSKGGRMNVAQSLHTESWKDDYAKLGLDSLTVDPPFLNPAVDELAKADRDASQP